MTNEKRFDVRFDQDAIKEYKKLDNSFLEIVNKQIDELEFRADEVGKMLKNKNSTKLAGCREIKLRDAGIRIVYRVTNNTVQVLRIVYILSIEKRSNDFVFKIADTRNKAFKKYREKELTEFLADSPKWNEMNDNVRKKSRRRKDSK